MHGIHFTSLASVCVCVAYCKLMWLSFNSFNGQQLQYFGKIQTFTFMVLINEAE